MNYRERVKDTATTTSITLYSREIPAGWEFEITHIAGMLTGTTDRKGYVFISGHGYKHYLGSTTFVAGGVTAFSIRKVIIDDAERLGFTFESGAGDVFDICLTGIRRMKGI